MDKPDTKTRCKITVEKWYVISTDQTEGREAPGPGHVQDGNEDATPGRCPGPGGLQRLAAPPASPRHSGPLAGFRPLWTSRFSSLLTLDPNCSLALGLHEPMLRSSLGHSLSAW